MYQLYCVERNNSFLKLSLFPQIRTMKLWITP